MEEIKIENELKLCEVKKENIRKAMEKIKSQGSDILVLNLQWCDLEDHLQLVEDKVEKRFKEVMLKEVELQDRSFSLEERAKVVEAAESEVSGLEMKAGGFRREIEEKGEELFLLRNSLDECNVEYMSKNDQLNELVETLRKTQVDLDLKVERLRQMETDFEKIHIELSAEMEHLGRTQTRSRELEEEVESKKKDLTLVLDKIVECGKLSDTGSLELVKRQGEVELKGKQLEQMNIDLERHRSEVRAEMERLDMSQTYSRELEEEIEGKRKKLTAVLDKTAECEKQLELVEKQLESQQKLLETQSSELVSKEETFKGLSIDLDLREQMVNSLNHEMEETCQRMGSKIKELGEIERQILERSGHNKSVRLLSEEYDEELALNEKRHNEITEAIRKLSLEIVSQEETLELAKAFSQQLHEEQHLKQEKLDLTETNLQKTIVELVSTEEKLHSVNDTYRECLQNWENKERELKSLQEEIKKTQDSLTDLQSKEKKQVRLKASLMELDKELGMKKKQFDALSKKIELKEKELHALEEMVDKKDQVLKSMEKKLAKCVKDYELKAKKLSSFCQQSNLDQHPDLVRDANVSDEKTLQLLLHGHLKKCPQLHLDISHALKASSDPAKLVLHTIQGLHQRMPVTQLDPNSVRRNSICLLECLMDMSPKPNSEVQGEAIKSATEWKNTTLVKADNPVEVLGFLHFLAAFSLAYTFDADKVQNLFDVAFLHKFAPSLCEALGISAPARVNKVQSLDDKPEQQPPEAPISRGSDSGCLDVQENIASSHLADEDALMDLDGSASFLPNEVLTGLQVIKDPGRYVLNSVNDELMGAQQRGELGLAEPILNNLVALLEELPRVVGPSNHLLLDALQVAKRWSWMMGTSAQFSPLQAWGFLQLIVAYGLAPQTNRDKTLQFASCVTHFKQAPKLFQSLGLCYAIPNIVKQLLNERHYILASRFLLFFKLNHSFSPMEFLKEEIINLRCSAKKSRRFKSQDEDTDAGRMRDLIELIVDFKLEIDLPVDLIVKFMVPREPQNQNQFVVSSSVPVQPPQFHTQALNTLIHSSYVATHGSKPSNQTSLGVSANQQILDLEIYQAGGSSSFQAQSSQAGFKRPRVDPSSPKPVIRPCFNPSGHSRF